MPLNLNDNGTPVGHIPYVNQNGEKVECNVYVNDNGEAVLVHEVGVSDETVYIHNFDDESYEHYDLNVSENDVDWGFTTTTAISGSAAEYYNTELQGGDVFQISDSGLDNYMTPGSEMSIWVRSDSANDTRLEVWFAYDGTDEYRARIDYEYDGLQIATDVDNDFVTEYTPQADEWYKIHVLWDDGDTFDRSYGETKAELYDENENLLSDTAWVDGSNFDGTGSTQGFAIGGKLWPNTMTSPATFYFDEAILETEEPSNGESSTSFASIHDIDLNPEPPADRNPDVTVSTRSELENAVSNASSGDLIVAEPGTYTFDERWVIYNANITIEAENYARGNSGSSDNSLITFNTSGDDSGVQLRGENSVFRGFEVSNSSWKGVNIDGDGDGVLFEYLDVHDSEIWGVMNNGCQGVTFRQCDSHDNTIDTQNTDGFNMTGSATEGLIEYCRAWNNGDDGIDTWVSENHVIRYNLAWNNGLDPDGTGDGIKLGGGPDEGGFHDVYGNVTWDNMRRGIDWNTTDNPLDVYNNLAFDNPINYRFDQDGSHYTLRNNISINGDVSLADIDDQYNSWNLGMDDLSLLSTDHTHPDFAKLPSDSPAIDAGTDVGLPYNGTAPDLGAIETDYE